MVARPIQSIVAFEVEDELPHRELTAATEAGLASARASLAEGASVDAIGRISRAKGAPGRIVRVELAVRLLAGAPMTLALAAERAFADAFSAYLSSRGFGIVRI